MSDPLVGVLPISVGVLTDVVNALQHPLAIIVAAVSVPVKVGEANGAFKFMLVCKLSFNLLRWYNVV